MLVYYGIPAGIVLLVALSAYLRDTETPKNRPFDWCFILVAAVLWPITAPFIVWKKVTALFSQQSQSKEGLVKIRAHRAPTLEVTSRH